MLNVAGTGYHPLSRLVMPHLMTQYRVAIHARIPICTTITKKLSRFAPQVSVMVQRWRHILQTPWHRADLSVHDNGAGRAICLQRAFMGGGMAKEMRKGSAIHEGSPQGEFQLHDKPSNA